MKKMPSEGVCYDYFDDAYIRLSKPTALSCARSLDGFENGIVVFGSEEVFFQCGRKKYVVDAVDIEAVDEYRYATVPPRTCVRVRTKTTPPEVYITFFSFVGTKKEKIRQLLTDFEEAFGG